MGPGGNARPRSAASDEQAGPGERVTGLAKPLTPGEPAEPKGQINVRPPEEYRRSRPGARGLPGPAR